MKIQLPSDLQHRLSEHGIEIPSALERIQELGNIVQFHRQKLNLYANKDVDNLWIKLAIESLYAIPHLSDKGVMLDVGSGSGIPALIYALLKPNLYVILTEAVYKKAIALERIRLQSHIGNASVYIGRAENHPKVFVDYISARAVAPLTDLWKWTKPFCKRTTKFVLFRGSNERQTHPTPEGLKMCHCEVVNPQGLMLWIAEVVSLA